MKFKVTYFLQDPEHPDQHRDRLTHTLAVDPVDFPQSNALNAVYVANRELCLKHSKNFNMPNTWIPFQIIEIKQLRP